MGSGGGPMHVAEQYQQYPYHALTLSRYKRDVSASFATESAIFVFEMTL
jgi:hypothetical protein